MAAKKGKVTAMKAVIYADPLRSAPIGFISQGKMISVGDKPLNKGQVYSVVVKGKLAFISASDVFLVDKKGEKAQMSSAKFERYREVAKDFYKYYLQSGLGMYSSTVSNDLNDSEQSYTFNEFSLKGDRAYKVSRFGLGVSLAYLQGSQADTILRANKIGIGPNFQLLRFKNFQLKLAAKALAIPWVQIEIESSKTKLNSYGYGAEAEIDVDIFLTKLMGISLSAGTRILNTLGFDYPSPVNREISYDLSGSYLQGAFVIRY